MKLVMDERVKHRLVGLAVILSLAAIFAPAIMKKSNQRFDGNVSVSVELPPKPLPPKISMPEKKAMFERVKVAHVEIAPLPEKKPLPAIAKAESLSQMNELNRSTASVVATARMASNHVVKQKSPLVVAATKVAANKKAPVLKPTVMAKNSKIVSGARNGYAVQLATFSKQQNAESLVRRLQAKGYKALYNKVTTRSGIVYKVIVGQTNKKEQAQSLQKQLANVMQIKGFIVATGIS